MNTLSIGKIRGLQQISNDNGILTMCAMDHRGSLQSKMEKEQQRKIGYQEMVEFKLELCDALSPCASAVLLDPDYGAAQCIAGNVLPKSTGLLVSIEATGYQSDPEGRVTTLLEGWGVEKIKRMGGSAVKILVYYRPDLGEISNKQLNTIRMVAEDCIKHDILFLVEPVTYAKKDENADSHEFAAQKSRMVIEAAKQITSLPIDVLKAEFPAIMKYETDEGKLLNICHQLDEASATPWVILSAGVDHETFCRQVEIACKAGASGFLGGRAIWQEAVKISGKKERVKFLSTTAVDRLKDLSEIAAKYGTPWYRKQGIEADAVTNVPESWYETY